MLRDFWTLHPDAEPPCGLVRAPRRHPISAAEDVRDVDQVDKNSPKFGIGGNKYRLIVAIHDNRGRIYVRHVLTHRECDKGKWKAERP